MIGPFILGTFSSIYTCSVVVGHRGLSRPRDMRLTFLTMMCHCFKQNQTYHISTIRTRTAWHGIGMTKRVWWLSIPPPSPLGVPIGYTPPPVSSGQYSKGNLGFDDVHVVVVTTQQSEVETKYKSALLNWRFGMSRLGFVLDLQKILLSAEALDGDPTEDIWVGIRGVSCIS